MWSLKWRFTIQSHAISIHYDVWRLTNRYQANKYLLWHGIWHLPQRSNAYIERVCKLAKLTYYKKVISSSPAAKWFYQQSILSVFHDTLQWTSLSKTYVSGSCCGYNCTWTSINWAKLSLYVLMESKFSTILFYAVESWSHKTKYLLQFSLKVVQFVIPLQFLYAYILVENFIEIELRSKIA